METPDNKDQDMTTDTGFDRKPGRIMGGVVLLVVGVLLAAYKAGADLPDWLFTWPMIIVAAGVFVGAKHRFRDWDWLFPVGIGVIFLLHNSFEGYSWHNLWPVIIIVAGLTMILNSGNKRHRRGRKNCF
jgi:hypothetical protein